MPYERIVGGTGEEKEVARRELEQVFEEKPEDFSEYEIEKTAEDKELIDAVIATVDDMVRSYGGDPTLVSPEKIHLLKPDSVEAITEGELFGGIHRPLNLTIGVEKTNSRFLLASVIAHELFHAKSYKAARVGESGEDVRLYRSGMSMIDRKDPDAKAGEEKEYFKKMEEAIVTECVRRFLEKISEQALFREEAKAVAQIKVWAMAYLRRTNVPEDKVVEFGEEIKYIPEPREKVEEVLAYSGKEKDREAYTAGMFRALFENKTVTTFERYNERVKFAKLTDELVQKSGGKFENREEVFAEFAKAHFTGNYLGVARIIEGELGKGAFRRVANEFVAEGVKEEGEA